MYDSNIDSNPRPPLTVLPLNHRACPMKIDRLESYIAETSVMGLNPDRVACEVFHRHSESTEYAVYINNGTTKPSHFLWNLNHSSF